jgi:colanic acid biosynthesis glycosyl transferase WcaI
VASILILVQVFPPDNVATAQLYGELVEELHALGNEVEVLTTLPHYSYDADATRWSIDLHGRTFPVASALHDGVAVHRFWMPKKRPAVLYRLGCWSWFHLASTVGGILGRFRPTVILSPSPPLTIGLCADALARRFRVPFIYNVQELYPDVAINLGAIKNRWLIGFLSKLESYVYARAAALTVISERMQERVLAKGVPAAKVFLVPNFADTERFKPLPKENAFSRRYDLCDKFVVSYAGNMGKPQHLDILLKAAAHLRSAERIRFLMIGDGAELVSLVRLNKELKLSNLEFLPYQPYSLMNQIYAASDISYVPQAAGTSGDGVPSKVYRVMACGRPVLAVTDELSDLAKLVESSGGGVVVPRDAEQVAEAIRLAFSDATGWARRGGQAREHILANYSRQRISRRYHELLNNVAKSGYGHSKTGTGCH